MDEYASKRASGEFSIARKESNLALGNSTNGDRSIPYCNRLGGSSRLNSIKGAEVHKQEKGKYSRPSFFSSSSKPFAGSSSKPFSGGSSFKKSHQSYRTEFVHSKSISPQEEGEGRVSDPSTTATEIETGCPGHGGAEAGVCGCVHSKTVLEEFGSSTITSMTRSRKQVSQQWGLGNKDTSISPVVRRNLSSIKTRQVTKATSQEQSPSSRTYGLKNFSCSSISDVLQSGCSYSNPARNEGTSVTKKKCLVGDSTYGRGTSKSGPSIRGSSSSQRSAPTGPSLSSLGRSSASQTIGARNRSSGSENSVASVRTRRSIGRTSKTQLSEHTNEHSSSLPEPLTISQLPQQECFVNESAVASSSRPFLTELPSCSYSSDGGPSGSNNENRLIAHPQDINACSFPGLLMDQDNLRRCSLDGIAELLLALERIEQDQELTYEQFLVLEANLLLGGLGFHDQHRDMRMDIDNMSYEELLALEEKMGSVSTALTEEELSNCLQRSHYGRLAGEGGDDIKCSICQEEYVVGEQIGELKCEHRYHLTCINQWLQRKNWCPICKVPVLPSHS